MPRNGPKPKKSSGASSRRRAAVAASLSYGLLVEPMAIGQIKPYPKNPRNNAEAIDKVAASLKEFGWRQPIVVDEHMVVIAGHTRLEAAKALGMEKVPVHVALGLTKAQIRAYRLADNKTGEIAEWDDELLSAELAALDRDEYNLELTGFDAGELGALLHPRGGILDGADVDDALALPSKPVTSAGDVITLGKHRLVCGDATKPADIDRLMAGAKAELLWTDPPYGVNYVGGTKAKLTIQNDSGAGLPELLKSAFTCLSPSLAPSARIYCASPAGPRGVDFRIAFLAAGWKFHQSLVWAKNALVLGHSDYHYRHEDVLFGTKEHDDLLYGWAPGVGRPGRGRHAGTKWFGDNAQSTVLEYDKPPRSAEHPTMKPVELIAHCLRNSSKQGDVVLDAFAGSGSTVIACEQERRVCYALELDPAYCDVIVSRWQTVTGKKAKRIAAA